MMRRQINGQSLRRPMRRKIWVATGTPRCQRTYWPTPEGSASDVEQPVAKLFIRASCGHSVELTVVIGDLLRGSVPIEYLAGISDSITGIQLTI